MLDCFFISYTIKNGYIYIYFLIKIYSLGADWFRQQDQWVSKHTENGNALSLIFCYES